MGRVRQACTNAVRAQCRVAVGFAAGGAGEKTAGMPREVTTSAGRFQYFPLRDGDSAKSVLVGVIFEQSAESS